MTKKPLELHERSNILKLRSNGMSILAISKEIHRSKRIVSAFLKDPVNYLKLMNKNGDVKNDNSSIPYDKLLNETPTANKNNNNTDQNETSTNNSTKSAPASSSSSSSTPASASLSPSSSVNKVTFEHRSVIKFLTKKGWNAIAIHDDMKHVYKSSTPSLPSIEYWVKECLTNPSINFNKITKKTPQKKKTKPTRIWVDKNSLKKVKMNLTNAAKQITNSSKEKDKNDKSSTSSSSSTNKNLLVFKLFDNSAKNNKSND